MLSRRGDLERLEHDRLLLGSCRRPASSYRPAPAPQAAESRDARKRHDQRRTLRDVSPHVVAVPHENPVRLHDRVTIGERVRPRMDALVLASWDQASGGGPTAYGRVCSGLWTRWETGVRPTWIATASIGMTAVASGGQQRGHRRVTGAEAGAAVVVTRRCAVVSVRSVLMDCSSEPPDGRPARRAQGSDESRSVRELDAEQQNHLQQRGGSGKHIAKALHTRGNNTRDLVFRQRDWTIFGPLPRGPSRSCKRRSVRGAVPVRDG